MTDLAPEDSVHSDEAEALAEVALAVAEAEAEAEAGHKDGGIVAVATNDSAQGAVGTGGDEHAPTKAVPVSAAHALEHHHVHMWTELPLYAKPEARQLWTDTWPRPHIHPSHMVIFQDLLYVAVTYQVGNVLADGFKDEGSVAILWFLAFYVCMYAVWDTKTVYAATFRAESVLHRCVEALEYIFLGIAAANLQPVKYMEKYDIGNSYALGFAISLAVLDFLQLAKWLELVLTHPRGSPVNGFGQTIAGLHCIAFSMKVAAAAIIPVYGAPLSTVLAIQAASCLGRRLLLLGLAVVDLLPRSRHVPVNVEYIIERQGAFVMVAIGEGVLQTMLVEAHPEDGENYWAPYLLSYMLLAHMQLVHYSSAPSHPDGHAFRRSKMTALIFGDSFQFFCATTVMIGVALKVVLKAAPKIAKDASYYFWLLNGSVAAWILFIVLQEKLHRAGACKSVVMRKVAWPIKIITVVVIAVLPLTEHVPAWAMLLILVVLLAVVLAVQVLSGAFEREVTKCVMMHSPQPGNADKSRSAGTATVSESHGNGGGGGAAAAAAAAAGDAQHNGKAAHDELLDEEAPAPVAVPAASLADADGEDDVLLDESGSVSSSLPGSIASSAASTIASTRRSVTSSLAQGKRKISRTQQWIAKRVGASFYEVPRPSVQWDALDKEFNVAWGDLFFDLSFVAAFFKIGLYLLYTLDHYEADHMFNSFALLLLQIDVWEAKLWYAGRFITGDTAHKLFDIVFATVHACTVGVIVVDLNTTVALQAALSGSFMLLSALIVGLYAEIWWNAEPGSPEEFSASEKVRQNSASVVIAALSFIPIYFQAPLWVALVMLLVVPVWWRFRLFWRVAGWSRHPASQRNQVPIFLKYSLHRVFELTCLAVGEGVIGLIIVSPPTRTVVQKHPSAYTDHMVDFCLSLLLLMAVMEFISTADTVEPSLSCGRHSRFHGVLSIIVRYFAAMPFLVFLGVALKGVLKHIYETELQFYWALSITSAVVLVAWSLVYQTHRCAPQKEKRMVTLVKPAQWMQLVLVALFLIWPVVSADPWVHVLLCFVTWLGATTLHAATEDYLHRHEKGHGHGHAHGNEHGGHAKGTAGGAMPPVPEHAEEGEEGEKTTAGSDDAVEEQAVDGGALATV